MRKNKTSVFYITTLSIILAVHFLFVFNSQIKSKQEGIVFDIKLNSVFKASNANYHQNDSGDKQTPIYYSAFKFILNFLPLK